MTTTFNQRPLFSILHTSARPDKWREVYDAWINAAVHPETVEYILCVDERWGFPARSSLNVLKAGMREQQVGMREQDRIVWNDSRRCYVDGVNTAAAASSGLILIVNADDQYPCANWDEELTRVLPPSPDFVVRISTGTPTEVERHLMVMPVMSRPRYDRQGYVFYPAYESMYADQDFCEAAEADGVVVEAQHLHFPHKHWLNEQREMDDVDQAQNRAEAYRLGENVLTERRLNRFGHGPALRTETEITLKPASTPRRETLGVAHPGQTFCGSWVVAWTELHAHLRDRFHVEMQLVYASNVHATRWHLYNGFRDMKSRPDWLLWIDDDNIVTPGQVEQLLFDLRANPDADMVAGWTWCATDVLEIKAHTSVGTLGNIPAQIPYAELMAGPDDLKEIGFTGFPVVLMRGGIFDKVGPESFAPIMGSQYARGFASEDIAFCIRAQAAGVKILVDRRVKVPHLKLREVRPTDLPMVQEQRETA